MVKTFISYSHSEHQNEKENIVSIINFYEELLDKSVSMGDISENLEDQKIRKIIRDEYLMDTTVTIILVGKNAKHRKHIDWEIFSSMFDGEKNSQSGIVVIDMFRKNTRTKYDSIKQFYNTSWTNISYSDIRKKYEYMPKRILDNLVNDNSDITIIPYYKIIENKDILYNAIIEAHNNRTSEKYDLSEPMRKKNNESLSVY